MNYQDTIQAIEQTRWLHYEAVKESAKLRKSFKRYGWYSEELAEDLQDRERTLYQVINQLIGCLPHLVTVATI